jgi:hypothetical protein
VAVWASCACWKSDRVSDSDGAYRKVILMRDAFCVDGMSVEGMENGDVASSDAASDRPVDRNVDSPYFCSVPEESAFDLKMLLPVVASPPVFASPDSSPGPHRRLDLVFCCHAAMKVSYPWMSNVLVDLCLDLYHHNRVVQGYEDHGVWRALRTWLLVCHKAEVGVGTPGLKNSRQYPWWHSSWGLQGRAYSRIATHAHAKFLSLYVKEPVLVQGLGPERRDCCIFLVVGLK